MTRVERRADRKVQDKRKRIVVVGMLVAALVLASAFLVGSGAIFTSTSANPANVFTAGILTQDNSNDGAAILTAGLMKPGDVRTGSVTITNKGDISGDFKLAMSKVGSSVGSNGGDLYEALRLEVSSGATIVYSGDLADFVGTRAAGTIASEASSTYTFTVTFPDTGTPASDTTEDNAYQGSSTTVEFEWTAVQS